VQRLFVAAKFAAAKQAVMNLLKSAQWAKPGLTRTLSVSKFERFLVKPVYLPLERVYEWQ
jgi:hypothetical protein